LILIDANILLYAEDSLSPLHKQARSWWDAQLSETDPVCLCWMVISAFIRIGTNPRVFETPLSVDSAVMRVASWLDQPCIRIIQPTQRHWEVFQDMLLSTHASANLVSDVHLAALAIEHDCELQSTDSDFALFPRLRWKNPIKESRQ